MGAVDRILELRKQRKDRREAVIASVRALPREDRQEVLAELLALEEADALASGPTAEAQPELPLSVVAPTAPVTPNVSVVPNAAWTEGPYVVRAEALVLASLNGIKTAAVGNAIGQKTANADGTLRQVAETRGTIERRDGLWWPVPNPAPIPKSARKTHRKALLEVVAAAAHPMGQGDIITEVQRIDPTRPTESLEQEMTRLRADKLIAESGVNGRGNLYIITNKGREVLVS